MDSKIRNILRDLFSGNELLSRQVVVRLLHGEAYKEVAQLYANTFFEKNVPLLQHTIGAMCRVIAASSRDIRRALSISEEISAQLDECNGRRRTRLLDHQDIASVISRTYYTDQYETILGGSVSGSYSYPAYTTAALCFRPFRSRTLCLGIAECPASAASMGRCWPILQPWHSSTRSSAVEATRLANLEAWAQNSNRIRIPKYLAPLVSDLLYNYWRSDGTSDWIRRTLEPENTANFLFSIMDNFDD